MTVTGGYCTVSKCTVAAQSRNIESEIQHPLPVKITKFISCNLTNDKITKRLNAGHGRQPQKKKERKKITEQAQAADINKTADIHTACVQFEIYSI